MIRYLSNTSAMFKIQWNGKKLEVKKQKGDCGGPEGKGASYGGGHGNEMEEKDGRKVIKSQPCDNYL